MENIVRPARAEDKQAILAFTQNTFSWGDYIDEVYDDWLTYEGGRLLVATANDQPVGLLHAAFIDDHVAWMEGMRVHPDFRRQGIGSMLDRHARQVARENGCRKARLVTSIKNITAQKTVDSEHYTRAAQFNEWEITAIDVPFSQLSVARARDTDTIRALWQSSEIAHVGQPILPSRFWRWTDLFPRRLSKQIDLGEVRVNQNGFALVLAFDEKDWRGLGIHALVGGADAIYAMAIAVRGEAHYRGYPDISAVVIDHPAANAGLERAGYERSGGMYVYEQAL